MKPKTNKGVYHVSDDSDNDSELEMPNKCEETNEEIQVTDSDVSDELEKEVEKTLKKNTPKSKKVVKKSSEDNNKEMTKTLVTGEEFKKLQRKAKRLGAKSLDYSNRKNNKYVVEYNGKKIHFGSIKFEDFLSHKDKERREKYLARAKKIKANKVN